MKKMVLLASVMVAISLASCGGNNAGAGISATDSLRIADSIAAIEAAAAEAAAAQAVELDSLAQQAAEAVK